MRFIDITLTISNQMPVWPGQPNPRLERVSQIEDGADANVTTLELSVHTGTHVDAPVHFLPGEKGVDKLDLNHLIGTVAVVVVPDEVDEITSSVLRRLYLPQYPERILFRTRNSRYWAENNPTFQTDFVGISEDAAEMLVDMRVKLVGLDYLSIAPYKKARPTHEILLKNGVTILEGVDLSQVDQGYYSIICMPLKLAGSDGAPARVVLIEE